MTPTATIALGIKHSPWLGFVSNPFGNVGTLVALILSQCFVATCIVIQHTIVSEKEMRIKEGLMMMGVDWKLYWLSWFSTHFTFAVATALGLSIVGSYVFSYSSPGIMFVYFTLYLTSVITFSYALSALFSTSRRAAVIGAVVYQLTVAPAMTATAMYPDGSSGWMWSMLLPSGSIYIWGEAIKVLEEGQIGITSATLNTRICDGYNITPNVVLGMTTMTIFIYALLAYYLEAVFPSKYGQKLVPWFFLMPSYWNGASKKNASGGSSHVQGESESLGQIVSKRASQLMPSLFNEHHDENGRDESSLGPDSGVISEPMGPDDFIAITIRRLTKRFGGGGGTGSGSGRGRGHTAVDALSLEMAEGHITALLGGNGAGKTTTISMLTGLITMTSGSASIYGYDVSSEMGRIRRSLGVCPQFDTLWLRLTVREHIMLYGVSRGIDRTSLSDTMPAMLASVGMEHKMSEAVSSLSGGQKRKLSLLIALLGDPRTVFLDEPTSGMDPYSRRLCWKVLRNSRRNKAMVLTTHFMDEVDVLADRCAIMTEGELVCVGTTSFLKSHYGVGYHIDVEVCPTTGRDNKSNASASSAAGVPRTMEERVAVLTGIFKRQVPNCEFRSADGTDNEGSTSDSGKDMLAAVVAEATDRDVVRFKIALPKEDVIKFPNLLRELERTIRDGSIGTVNYGLSCTTLDDVFLRTSSSAKDRARERAKMLTSMPDAAAAADDVFGNNKNSSSNNESSSMFERSILSPDTDASFVDDPTVVSTPLVGSPTGLSKTSGSLFGPSDDSCDQETTPGALNGLSSSSGERSVASSYVKLTGVRLRLSQLMVLMWKRLLNFKRDMPTILFQLVLPPFFVLVACLIMQIEVVHSDMDPIVIGRAAQLLNKAPAYGYDTGMDFFSVGVANTNMHSAHSIAEKYPMTATPIDANTPYLCDNSCACKPVSKYQIANKTANPDEMCPPDITFPDYYRDETGNSPDPRSTDDLDELCSAVIMYMEGGCHCRARKVRSPSRYVHMI